MLREIRAGSDMVLEMVVIDLSTGFPTPYDPDSITLTLQDSAGNTSALGIAVSSVLGYWTHQHHICGNATNGVYTAVVAAVKGSVIARIQRFVPWVVTSSLSGHFDYLRLASPNAHVWYLSVVALTITPVEADIAIDSSSPTDACYSGVNVGSSTVPTALKTADTTLVPHATIPYWVSINNAGILSVVNSDPGGAQQDITPATGFSMLGHDQVTYALQAVRSGILEILKPVPIAYPGL